MTKRRRMPVNVLAGAPQAEAVGSVLDGIVGEARAPTPAGPVSKKSPAKSGRSVDSAAAPVLQEPPAAPVAGVGPAVSQGRPEWVRDWREARRLRRAGEIVRARAVLSLLVGLVPWLPPALAALVGIHLASLRALSEAYRVPLDRNLGRGAVASLLGTGVAVAAARLAASLLRVFPIPAWLAGALCLGGAAAASTYVLGRVFIKHFEAGETLLSLDPTATKDYFRQTLGAGPGPGPSTGE